MTYAWVDAAPFRAHLLHVSAATRLPWRVLAVHAGVPLKLAERVVARPVGQKLPAVYATRLLRLTAADGPRIRTGQVWAAGTAALLTAMLAAGASPAALASMLGCTADHVVALASGSITRTTIEIALRVQVRQELTHRSKASGAGAPMVPARSQAA
ncbi:MAG: hypothetical protein QM708_12530 [Propioniciclava sp.]|uniref:hypothetical protein n=1 Tax=Propioniciclava sp. TaxID=2038686 RepID=UPI0039E5F1F9